jgi:hypothetical protein
MMLWVRSQCDNAREGRPSDSYVHLERQRDGRLVEVVLSPSALERWLDEHPDSDACILETVDRLPVWMYEPVSGFAKFSIVGSSSS